MNKLCFILVIVSMFLITGCSIKINGEEFSSIDVNFNDGNNVEKTEVTDLQVEGQEKLNISNARGEISIVKWDKPTIQITAVKKVRGNKDQKELDKLFDKIKIDTKKGSQDIEVTVKYIEGFRGSNYQAVNLEVKVPEKMKIINANSASGNIKLKDFIKLDEIKLISASGNIDVKNLDVQKYELGASSGNIDAAGITGNGSIHTVSGCISMKKMMGDIRCVSTSGTIDSYGGAVRLVASTVSGSLNINEEYLKDASEFSSVSGSLYIKAAKLDARGAYKLNSTSGGVEFAIPEKTGFNLNAKSISGNVDCDFELTLQGGEIKRNNIKGITGSGNINVYIETISGGINVTKY